MVSDVMINAKSCGKYVYDSAKNSTDICNKPIEDDKIVKKPAVGGLHKYANPSLGEQLIGVCDDMEIDEFVVLCYRKNRKISYEWTTEESGIGIVNVEDFKFAVKQ